MEVPMKKILLISLFSLACLSQEASAKIVATCPAAPNYIPITLNNTPWLLNGVPLTYGTISADGKYFMCMYNIEGQNSTFAYSLSFPLEGHGKCQTVNCENASTQGSPCTLECDT